MLSDTRAYLRSVRVACLLVTHLIVATGLLRAEEVPLYSHIDSAIRSTHVGAMAAVTTDAEFLRRCSLDLIGRIPTREEVRSFLADTSAAKREQAADRLLKSDEFNHFFAIVLDVMLMERRQGSRITTDDWRAYLVESLAAHKPYDQMAREILSTDGTEQYREAAKFYLDRDVEAHALTRDVGRMFLGRDLQCAQCHDHPLISDYLQSEYYGVFAFLSRSYLFEDAKQNKKAFLGEKAEGVIEFSSVFEPDAGKSRAMPQLVGGLTLEGEPRYDADDAYVAKPEKGKRSVPRFSRRRQFSNLITHHSSNAFALNIVNRLWAHMMGHGIVEPVDRHHADNPASHPQLLQHLAEWFVAEGYDIRQLLKQIVLSQSYQRSIDIPDGTSTEEQLSETNLKLTRTREQRQAAAEEFSRESANSAAALNREREQLAKIDAGLLAAENELRTSGKEMDETGKKLTETKKLLTEKQKQAAAVAAAAEQSKKAAEAVANDTELQEVASKLEARSAALQKEVEALKADLATHQKARETSQQLIATKRRELARLREDRVTIADLVAEARGAHRAVLRQHDRQLSAIEDCRQQQAAVQLGLAYTEKRDELTRSVAKLDVAAGTLATVTTKIGEVQNVIAGLESKIVKQQEQVMSSRLAATSLAGAIEKKRQLVTSLKESNQLAGAVSRDLDDRRLTDALADLTLRIKETATQVEKSAAEMALRQASLVRQQQGLRQLRAELAKCEETHSRLEGDVSTQREQVKQAEAEVASAQAAKRAAHESLVESWTRRFAVRSLKPMIPEQLASSTVTALRLTAGLRREAEAEWEKQNKDKKSEEVPAEKRQAEIHELLKKRRKQVESTFVSLFAAPPASPQDVFSATVDQALFMANDGQIINWLKPSEDTLIHRLQKQDNEDQMAEELYMSILSRLPTSEEREEAKGYVASREKDSNEAVQELVWGILNSAEFRFNH